jgi:hypothetical protein
MQEGSQNDLMASLINGPAQSASKRQFRYIFSGRSNQSLEIRSVHDLLTVLMFPFGFCASRINLIGLASFCCPFAIETRRFVDLMRPAI